MAIVPQEAKSNFSYRVQKMAFSRETSFRNLKNGSEDKLSEIHDSSDAESPKMWDKIDIPVSGRRSNSPSPLMSSRKKEPVRMSFGDLKKRNSQREVQVEQLEHESFLEPVNINEIDEFIAHTDLNEQTAIFD